MKLGWEAGTCVKEAGRGVRVTSSSRMTALPFALGSRHLAAACACLHLKQSQSKRSRTRIPFGITLAWRARPGLRVTSSRWQAVLFWHVSSQAGAQVHAREVAGFSENLLRLPSVSDGQRPMARRYFVRCRTREGGRRGPQGAPCRRDICGRWRRWTGRQQRAHQVNYAAQ